MSEPDPSNPAPVVPYAAIVADNDEGVEYRLNEEAYAAWLRVDGLALKIRRETYGCKVEVFRNGEEMENPIGLVQFHA